MPTPDPNAPRPEGDKRLNFNDARSYLGIGMSTLRDYVRTGRVQAYRMGGGTGRLLFFWKSDLDALFEPVSPSQAAKMMEDDGEEGGDDADNGG